MDTTVVHNQLARVSWRRFAVTLPAGAALGIAFDVILGFALGTIPGLLLWVFAAGGIAILYRQPSLQAVAAAALFYFALEALLVPVAFLLWVLREGPTAESIFTSILVLGGMVALVWVVAWTIGLVAYLLSQRLDTSE